MGMLEKKKIIYIFVSWGDTYFVVKMEVTFLKSFI